MDREAPFTGRFLYSLSYLADGQVLFRLRSLSTPGSAIVKPRHGPTAVQIRP